MPPTLEASSAPPIGPLIRTARQAKGLDQWDLARAIGATQASVSRWEKGVVGPSFPFRARLAQVLDLPEILTA